MKDSCVRMSMRVRKTLVVLTVLMVKEREEG